VKLSISQFSAAIGRDRSTVTRRVQAAGLEPVEVAGTARLYHLQDLIGAMTPELLRVDGADRPHLDLAAERARLASESADKVALQNRVARGELIPADEITACWGQVLGYLRARALQIPGLAAPAVTGLTDVRQVRRILERHVHDALATIQAAGEDGRWLEAVEALDDIDTEEVEP
jgi:hypothetical protein